MALTRWFRKHQRYILAALVIVLMLVWGIGGSLTRMAREESREFEIAGRSVTAADLQQARRALRMALLLQLVSPRTALYAQQRDPALASDLLALATDFRSFVFGQGEPRLSPEAAWRYLVLLTEAQEGNVKATEAEAYDLLSAPIGLSSADGADPDTVRRVLRTYQIPEAQAGRWAMELARIAKLITLQREAVLASDAEIWMDYQFRNEQMKVDYVQIDAALFRPLVEVSTAELRDFYEQHRGVLPSESEDGIGYMAPERVRVEYAVAAVERMEQRVEVSPEEVAAYYSEHKEDYLVEEEESEAENGGESEPVPEGREPEKAEDGASKERAGQDETSTEPESPEAENEPPEEAEQEEPSYRPLQDVREEIRKKLLEQKARALAEEKVEAAAAGLRAVSENYENMPMPLEQMARRHGLDYRTPAADGDRLLSRQQLTQEMPDGAQIAEFAFGGEQAVNYPQTFETEQGPLLLQVRERRPPQEQPFAAVRDRVREDLVQRKALEQAGKFAARLREQAAQQGLQTAVHEFSDRLANLVADGEGDAEEPLLKVQQTGLFSRDARAVEGLSGPPLRDFTERAFSLEEGHTAAVAPGPPAQRVFVIRAAERQSASPDNFAQAADLIRARYISRQQRRFMAQWSGRLLEESPVPEKLGEE